MENKLQIPEILLYNVIDTILKTIRKDLLDNVEEKNTIFYKLFYGTKFENLNLDFYSNAKDIFSRDKSHPRFLDLRMFFNADRANIPTIHLNLPSESDIGGGVGVDAGYNGTNYDPISQTISQNHTRTFNTIYNIIITSDNSDEVLIIYHALRAFMVSLLDIIDLNGLRNPKLGGADLQINPELIPPHIFIRAISLNCFYELTIPSLIKEQIINKIKIVSLGLIEDTQTVSLIDLAKFVKIIDGSQIITRYEGEGYVCQFGNTPVVVIDSGEQYNVYPGDPAYQCKYGPPADGETHNSDQSISIIVPSGSSKEFPDGKLIEWDLTETDLIAGKNYTAKVPDQSKTTDSLGNVTHIIPLGINQPIANSSIKRVDGIEIHSVITEQPQTISSSNVQSHLGGYNVDILAEEDLILPKTPVTNSDGSYNEDFESCVGGAIADITVTNPITGATYPYPAKKDLTESTYKEIEMEFLATYADTLSRTITVKSAGTYANETLTNCTVVYTVNAVVKTLPFTVVDTDILTETITRINPALYASVVITT